MIYYKNQTAKIDKMEEPKANEKATLGSLNINIIRPLKLYFINQRHLSKVMANSTNCDSNVKPNVNQQTDTEEKGANEDSSKYSAINNDAVNWMMMSSDTFSVLCDINCHRWILWLIGHCGLYPKFFIPSTNHFLFGSVHDVSSRIHQQYNSAVFSFCDFLFNHQCVTIPSHERPKPRRNMTKMSHNVVSPAGMANMATPNPSKDSTREENDDQEFANQGAMEESSSFGAISSGQKNERIPITPHSVLTFLFYLTVAIRYALHLVLIRLHHRSVPYVWSPLVVALVQTISSTITAYCVYSKKCSIEDLIISSASFLKPLSHRHRIIWIKMIPMIYFTFNVCFLLTDIVGSIYFARHDPRGSNWHWHQSKYTFLLNGTVANNSATFPGTLIGWTKFDPVGNNTKFNSWSHIVYIDLFARVYITFGMLLIKTFYFSLTMLVILKCIQMFHETQSLCLLGKKPTYRNEQNNSRRSSPFNLFKQNRENERLSILTQILLNNIRQYDHIFSFALFTWLLASTIIIIAINEFYNCKKVIKHLQQNEQNWFEPLFHYYHNVIHLIDLILFALGFIIIRIYRRRLLTN